MVLVSIAFLRYWVFRSWGRVGTVIGSNKLEQMPSKEDAVEHFLNLYEEKTGNSWHSKNFTKYPKKFYPLEIDYGQVTLKWPCPRCSIAEVPCVTALLCACPWISCTSQTRGIQMQLLHLPSATGESCRSRSAIHLNRPVGKLKSFLLSDLLNACCCLLCNF